MSEQADTRKSKERPIIFSGEMVRAILEGRKTQTRRVVKPQPVCRLAQVEGLEGVWYGTNYRGEAVAHTPKIFCPYGVPGDRLWVRETWADEAEETPGRSCAPYLRYRADGDDAKRWRPSIHMPRWASRILLEITNVRVERLQEITWDGVIDEGVWRLDWSMIDENWKLEWIRSWNQIQLQRKDPGGKSWADNPWVWVIEFRELEDGNGSRDKS